MKSKYFWLIGLLVAYSAFMNYYFVPVTGGTDSNGYHTCAKMIASQGQFHQTPIDDYQFIGNMWVVNERDEFYPKYPPLYPALAAGAITVFGNHGGFYLCPILAIFAVLGMFFLCRFFMPEKLAVVGSFLLATSPVFNHFALSKVSHGPSMAFLIWGFVCFFVAVSRRRLKTGIIYAMLAGLLLGYAEGIRYTNIILLIPPVLYGLFFLRKKRLWILASFSCGVAIPYLFLCWYHWSSFGSPITTGYSLTNEQSGFGLSYFWINLRLYIPGLISDGTGLVTSLALVGLVICFTRNKKRAWVFLAWIIPLLVIYMFYYWAPTTRSSSYLRFILPIFVPIYILALSALWQLTKKYSHNGQMTIVLLLVVIHGIWGVCASLEDSEKYYLQQSSAKKVVDFTLAQVPAGSVIFADYGSLNSLDFEKRWILYSSSILDQRYLKKRLRRSLENSVSGLQKQRAELLKKQLLDVSRKEFHKTIMALISNHLQQGREVYILGSGSSINSFKLRYQRYLDSDEKDKLEDESPLYRIYPVSRSSSRVDKAKKTTRILVKQLIQIVAVRKKPLNVEASIKTLRAERSLIIRRIREKDETIQGDIYRLETISRQLVGLYRAKRIAEGRRKKRLAAKNKKRKK
ncbi:MAG: glycosyltransferase family 39 protein [Victivallaceae bacterium]|nr:glycosyltransferase family 39 protein [Victivallaceae bacterium]